MQYMIESYFTASGVGEPDPLQLPLVEQLRVQSIRQYRMENGRQKMFWTPVLAMIEREIDAMVAIAQNRSLPKNRMSELLDDKQSRIEEIYRTELSRLARSEGKSGAAPLSKTDLRAVTARLLPDAGEIKYMSGGKFLMHYFRNQKDPDWNDPQWDTAAIGAPFIIGERTRFMVRWQGGGEYSATLATPPVGGDVLVADRRTGFRWEKK